MLYSAYLYVIYSIFFLYTANNTGKTHCKTIMMCENVRHEKCKYRSGAEFKKQHDK